MERDRYEHYTLEKEIANSNIATLLELFKRESEKYNNKGAEYFNSLGRLTDEGKKQIEKECQLLLEGRQKIAMSIAEKLTDVKSFAKLE